MPAAFTPEILSCLAATGAVLLLVGAVMLAGAAAVPTCCGVAMEHLGYFTWQCRRCQRRENR